MIIFFALLILLILCNVTALYKGYYNEIILYDFATVESSDRKYAIEIEYINTIDESFSTDKDPQIHYNMQWTEEGVSLTTYTEVEKPPTRYVIKWKNVFQEDPL